MFKRILIPVDGSDPSDAAVDIGTRFAADQGAQLAFVHTYSAARTIAMTSGAGMSVLDPSIAVEAERQNGLTILQEALARTPSASNAAQFLEEGDCVDSILGVARRWNADLIIIGSHGRGGLARALVGSVAEGVMRRAWIPVLVLHAGMRFRAEAVAPLVGAAVVVGTPHEVDPIC